MKAIFLWVMCFTFFIQCKSDSKSGSAISGIQKPGISAEEIEKLAAEATNMDIIFYNMNISLSQNDKNSLMQTAHFFAPDTKPEQMNCPSIGRIMLQNNGNIILEADIHYAGNCQYFTIIQNKATKGTNAMTKQGAYFINQILSSYKPQ